MIFGDFILRMWLIFLPHLLFAEGPPTEGPSLGLPLGIYTNHFGKVTKSSLYYYKLQFTNLKSAMITVISWEGLPEE